MRIDRLGLACKCGPDITEALKGVSKQIMTEFDRQMDKHPIKMSLFCQRVLLKWQYIGFELPTVFLTTHDETRTKGDTCRETVIVGNKCHDFWDVDYFLWGVINKACSVTVGSAIGKARFWKDLQIHNKGELIDADFGSSYARNEWTPSIEVWTRAGYEDNPDFTTTADEASRKNSEFYEKNKAGYTEESVNPYGGPVDKVKRTCSPRLKQISECEIPENPTVITSFDMSTTGPIINWPK